MILSPSIGNYTWWYLIIIKYSILEGILSLNQRTVFEASKVTPLVFMSLRSIGSPASVVLMPWWVLPPRMLPSTHQAGLDQAHAVLMLCLVGYQSLVGSSVHSWGWDLGRCKAYHNADNIPGTPYPLQDTSYQAPDRFLMVLDMDLGTLAFSAKGKYLGVSHLGFKGKAVFPIISSVWGHCEVSTDHAWVRTVTSC